LQEVKERRVALNEFVKHIVHLFVALVLREPLTPTLLLLNEHRVVGDEVLHS